MKKMTFFTTLCLSLLTSLIIAGSVEAKLSLLVSSIIAGSVATEGECSIKPKDGRIILDLKSSKLCSPKASEECPGKSDPVIADPPIPAGTYDITLQSFDDHGNDQVQLSESYFLSLFDTSDDQIVNTNVIDDLPDGVDNLIQKVNTDLSVGSDIGSVLPIHFCYNNTKNVCSGPNSIAPVCVAFDLKEPDLGTGRFTGGGRQIVAGLRVTMGLTVHCDLFLSNNLQVNWKGGSFHMTEHLETVECSDNPDINQSPPAAPLDTLVGVGAGRYNGQDGFTIEFTLVDGGEPGREDGADLLIYETADPSNIVLEVPFQSLANGNLQAHFDQPHR